MFIFHIIFYKTKNHSLLAIVTSQNAKLSWVVNGFLVSKVCDVLFGIKVLLKLLTVIANSLGCLPKQSYKKKQLLLSII